MRSSSMHSSILPNRKYAVKPTLALPCSVACTQDSLEMCRREEGGLAWGKTKGRPTLVASLARPLLSPRDV